MIKLFARSFPILLWLLLLVVESFSQTKNSYCYYPSDKNAVKHSGIGTMNFYVSSFNSTNPSASEFVIIENGKIISRLQGIRFTIDGAYEAGKPIDYTWNDNGTVRLYINMSNRNSVAVYFTHTGEGGIETAGPITFVSSNNGRNTGYSDECANNNVTRNNNAKTSPEYPDKKTEKAKATRDTNVLVKFRPPRTFMVQSAQEGSKTQILHSELLSYHIVPTKGMLTMIDQLNPGIKGNNRLSSGTSVQLPAFRQIDQKRQAQVDRQLDMEDIPDMEQNIIFREKSRQLDYIIQFIAKSEKAANFKELIEMNQLLMKVVNNPKISLRKYHTDMLNDEIQRFTNRLLQAALNDNEGLLKPAYVHSFSEYVTEILKHYIQPGKVRAMGVLLPYLKFSALAMPAFIPGDYYAPGDGIDIYIHVFMWNATDYIDSMYSCWVYCLTGFQFDNLNEQFPDMDDTQKAKLNINILNQMISIDDLPLRSRCEGLASVTAKKIELIGNNAYHFIVVSKDLSTILMHDMIDPSAIPEHTEKIKEPYGIGIYQEIKGK